MDFNELIAGFADRHGVENLVADGGAVALDIDGIIVSIVSSGDVLTVSADIGEPPAEGAGAFSDILLEANLQSEAVFAKTHEPENYVCVRRLALGTLDATAFDAALEAFVNNVETWRRILVDFRPVAKSAAEKAGSESVTFGSSGFMQV